MSNGVQMKNIYIIKQPSVKIYVEHFITIVILSEQK